MRDITTIGEVLIDLTQTGRSEAGVPLFAAYPGGAPVKAYQRDGVGSNGISTRDD